MEPALQIDLFGDVDLQTLSIEEAATRVGVSTATIRNWLKTGYLVAAGRGQIAMESFERFLSEIAGKEKLTRRANKSCKDEHDHLAISRRFLEEVEKCSSDFESLGDDYESSLSDSYRNKEGVYYTPKAIVCDLLNDTNLKLAGATFCDPCCGSGNFVSQALALGFRPENIYAYDIDPVAVAITRRRIFIESGYRSTNIKEANFFDMAVSNNSPVYDCIFTNPPWGKKISNEERSSIGALLRAGDSIDTCSLFFFACLKCLSHGGELGLLLPEAFFNIATYESARIRMLDNSVKRLIDYDKAFKGLVTKAQGIVLEKRSPPKGLVVNCSGPRGHSRRDVNSFRLNPKSILNHYCSREDADVISHIFSLPHITLKDQASWGLGIVTGNNNKFVENEHRDGLVPVFKGADILSKSRLDKPTAFIPDDFSLYQQVAPLKLYQAKEKLIYKFISSTLCFFCDTEQRFVLNSSNILIPETGFPVSVRLLGELLSSDFMNWLFTKIFNTHKILRGDIESLPIHTQFLNGENFNEEDYVLGIGIKRIDQYGTYRIKE